MMERPWLRDPLASRHDAIVIGSGVGGAVTAALLAHRGLRVLVLEKNETVGGIMASTVRRGIRMDVGSHLIPRGAKGPLGRVLATLGLRHPRFLTHRIPSRSRGIFESTLPRRRRGLLAYAWRAARDLHVPTRDAAAIVAMLGRMLTMGEDEIESWDRRSLDAFIRSYTEHPASYFLFSFLISIFFVLPPWDASAGEGILCFRHLLHAYSLSYIEGGMDRYITALLETVVGAGGAVAVERRVTGIVPGEGGLLVVTETGEEYEAPFAVCNMAPADAVRLLPEGSLPEAYLDRVEAIRPSMNAYQMKLVLRRPLVEEGSFVGGVSLRGLTPDDLSLDLLRETCAEVMRGRIADPISVYAPVPTNFDPTLAPGGRQLIVASIYGTIREDTEDPPERWERHILAMLASIIPGLEDELEFHEFTDIPDVGRWMGKRSNGAICNGQVPGQVGKDRLPVTTPLPGLFLCGDGAGGRGIGTELAAASGMLAARRILASDVGRPWCAGAIGGHAS